MPDRLTVDQITSDQLDALYEQLEYAERPGPREHCGDQKPTGIGRPPTECVLRPDHQGSHADAAGVRWWLANVADSLGATRTELAIQKGVTADYRVEAQALRDKLEGLEAELVGVRSSIDRARALHREDWGSCFECTHEMSVRWPCPTIRALDGTEQQPDTRWPPQAPGRRGVAHESRG